MAEEESGRKYKHRGYQEGAAKEPPPKKSPKKDLLSKRYKEQLGELFDEGFNVEETEEGDREIKIKKKDLGKVEFLENIEDAQNYKERIAVIDKYLEMNKKLSDDYDILIRILEHPNDDVIQKVLKQIDKIIDKQKPRRTLRQYLETIIETNFDDQIVSLASAIMKKIG